MEQANIQVKILISTHRPISANFQHSIFSIHHSHIIKRLSATSKLSDILILQRYFTNCIWLIWVMIEFREISSKDGKLRTICKHRQLKFTALRNCNIVCIHLCNQIIFAIFQPDICSCTDSNILFQPSDLENIWMLMYRFINYQLKFFCKRSITNNYEIIRHNGLVHHAVNCLLKIFRFLLFIHRH